jgi:hypothetical protein
MFSKALDFLKGLIGSFSLLAPILAAFGVVIAPQAIALAPVAVAMMNAAEAALGDGTGPLKKEAVTAGMTAFVAGMAAVSTGGQKETYEKIDAVGVSTLIDTIATVGNNIAATAGQAPVFDNSIFEQMQAEAGRG